MTFDELNKKYPESREEMDTERERAFLKDCYDAYDAILDVQILSGFLG